MPAQIIITGDDFGISSQVNEVIEAEFLADRLTHTSLMVEGDAADEAIRIAQRNPGLQIGLHLTLQHVGIPEHPVAAGFWLWRKRRDPDFMQRLSKGISDQFFALRKFFPHASHWDGHQHLHLHPVVFAIAARAAAQAGFQRVRLLLKPETCHLHSLALALISRSALPHARTADQRWPDQVYGLRDTGRMTRQRLKTLQETTTRPDARLIEIYYHPGADAMVE